jgi:hypothetical protein
MGSTPPANLPSRPPRGKAQRPWYLIVALVGAWLLGASGLVNGCNVIAFYKSDLAEETQASGDESDKLSDLQRAAVQQRDERLLGVLDGARTRVFPIAVAMLLLGGAMVVLSARAMAGREGARGGLVQVAAVQAALIALAYAMTGDVRAAENDLRAARGERMMRYAAPVALGVQTLASALIILALTRPRSRAFYASMEASLSER